MRILAVYGSRFGQAESVLQRISRVLESHGHTVTLFKGDAVPRDLALPDYDAVIIAASIIMGRYQPYIRTFVQRHAGGLNARPSAFVSVNGHSPESAPEWRQAARQYVQAFLADTAWQPHRTATFSGALRYQRYGLVTKWIMKMISRRTGGPTDVSRDYEFTDWNAVDAFAHELAGKWAQMPALPV
jgi:menaquinone-dependent protoporphyrinogen oxidase